MLFQIKKLVLWSRNPTRDPRVLEFSEGMVNVITGASKTGKSAVIPIIDYCLGSEHCAVPVRTIRDACSWFGIVVATSEGEKLLARREPGDQQSTGDMYLLEGRQIRIPRNAPDKNTTADAVKGVLDRLAGLSNLSFDPTGPTAGFRGRPSFRDLLAFTFQPQNIVANPNVLFFRADTTEHRQKLETIFPYVLGALTPDLLAKQWELEEVQRELRRKERELAARTQATEIWRAELASWLSEARDFGLATAESVGAATDEKEMLDLLRGVVAKSSMDVSLSAASVDAGAREAVDLQTEESAAALELSQVRQRLDRMVSLRANVDEYTGALNKQRERLELSRWFREIAAKDERCPVCGGAFDEPHAELDALCDALALVEASARQMTPVPAAFDRELATVRDEVRRLTDRLQAVRVRKRALLTRSTQAQQAQRHSTGVDRFIGRTEQALRMFSARAAGGNLEGDIDRLRSEAEALRSTLASAQIYARQRAALARVSNFMARLLPSLDAEKPNDPTELDLADLTIRVTSDSGRKDYLWELGSGANWLSYHVASLVALHQLFLEQSGNPVPAFLVFDQPSQVYFPQILARGSKADEDPKLNDEDVRAIRKVFLSLGQAVGAAARRLQVLVLDHAGHDVWGNLPGVHLVEEWRSGPKLVPEEWLAK
jgi:hypothetical protein